MKDVRECCSNCKHRSEENTCLEHGVKIVSVNSICSEGFEVKEDLTTSTEEIDNGD